MSGAVELTTHEVNPLMTNSRSVDSRGPLLKFGSYQSCFSFFLSVDLLQAAAETTAASFALFQKMFGFGEVRVSLII